MNETKRQSPWPRLFGILIIWGGVLYLVIEDHLDTYDLGEAFFTGLFLIVALIASLAIWWGIRADLRIQIGAQHDQVGASGFGKGFVLGGLIILLMGLVFAIPSVNRIQELDRRLSDLSQRRAMMRDTPVLIARTDLKAGQIVTLKDIRDAYIPGLQFNSQYFTAANVEDLLGSRMKHNVFAGTVFLSPLVEPIDKDQGEAENSE